MFDRSVGFMFRVMKQLLNHTSVLVLHQAGGVGLKKSRATLKPSFSRNSSAIQSHEAVEP